MNWKRKKEKNEGREDVREKWGGGGREVEMKAEEERIRILKSVSI